MTHNKPTARWEDIAERTVLLQEIDRLTADNARLTAERDRARHSAILHDAAAQRAHREQETT